MTPLRMANLHKTCFPTVPRAWSVAEFEALVENPNIALVHQPAGFCVIQVLAVEAEILTIAVDPVARRQGVALALMANAEALLREKGTEDIFLEVAENNAAARALYARLGFAQVGSRKAYYAGTDALVLRKGL